MKKNRQPYGSALKRLLWALKRDEDGADTVILLLLETMILLRRWGGATAAAIDGVSHAELEAQASSLVEHFGLDLRPPADEKQQVTLEAAIAAAKKRIT